MRVTTIGTGYVGLVTGAMFAHRGNNVVCVDHKPEVVNLLNSGKIHIFEPGLEKIVKESVDNGNLSFTTNTGKAVRDSDVIFLGVGTPSNDDGSFNLSYLKNAATDTANALKDSTGFKVIVGKSTVPQGTNNVISEIFNEILDGSSLDWAYVSNPETLAEGTAVNDFAKPDRVIIGTDSDKAFEIMNELYHPFMITKNRIERGSPADAELAKLFANTVLASRIAIINEMARIADVTPGADMDTIRRMVCEDSRIGYKFMFPSPGYGGSCFPKDVQGLVHQSRLDGYNPLILSQIHDSNEAHKNYMGERVSQLLSEKSPTIGVWGLTFKPNTDDMRDASSIPILTGLINKGANVIAYDPQPEKAKEIFGNSITFANDKYSAVKDADALILLTEWKQFDSPDYKKLSSIMSGSDIFDLRNRWLPESANRNGFNYYGVGRNYPLKD